MIGAHYLSSRAGSLSGKKLRRSGLSHLGARPMPSGRRPAASGQREMPIDKCARFGSAGDNQHQSDGIGRPVEGARARLRVGGIGPQSKDLRWLWPLSRAAGEQRRLCERRLSTRPTGRPAGRPTDHSDRRMDERTNERLSRRRWSRPKVAPVSGHCKVVTARNWSAARAILHYCCASGSMIAPLRCGPIINLRAGAKVAPS